MKSLYPPSVFQALKMLMLGSSSCLFSVPHAVLQIHFLLFFPQRRQRSVCQPLSSAWESSTGLSHCTFDLLFSGKSTEWVSFSLAFASHFPIILSLEVSKRLRARHVFFFVRVCFFLTPSRLGYLAFFFLTVGGWIRWFCTSDLEYLLVRPALGLCMWQIFNKLYWPLTQERGS